MTRLARSDYEDIWSDFLDLKYPHEQVSPHESLVDTWLDQDGFSGKIYALFAWESGGTYWDIDALGVNDTAFIDLVVKDIVDKIARQVTDFNFDFKATNAFVDDGIAGPIGDGDDIDDLVDMFGASTDEDIAKFDLNGDDVVDLDDVILLVQEIFGTWFGDADLDGDVDSDDNDIT